LKHKGHGRKKPPVELPHLPLEHPVPETEKVCAECGAAKKRIGEKVTEQLEYAPASLFVIDHIQPVWACPCCEAHVTVAPKPAQPIEKGLPGPGLLAQVVVSKYGDHLPLYRQESIFERHGVTISRQTMGDWVRASAHLLEPVVEAMKARILESKVIHTDDTPVTVREPGQSGTHGSGSTSATAVIRTRSTTTRPAESGTDRPRFWKGLSARKKIRAICRPMPTVGTTVFISAIRGTTRTPS
jgi:transposase